ncbi:zinc finger protein GLI4-like isoform X4 [Anguilla anguilla]|uniref:zinc finger protein GLI4-like isoform X4 n=1 Tax=Anguilla anguilla TaxID=7936 RepID=UPI0015A7C5EA|nr:zinc finger protein GLI4-like isoform X4 [Anguilla anguilla]
MCDSLDFHAQLAAIIDVLAKSAVAEISRLVDDGYSLLRLEVSQSQKQNEALKRRLRMMEQRFAQALIQIERAGVHENFLNNRTGVHISERSKKTTEDCSLTDEGKGERMNVTLCSDGELAAVHEEPSPGQPDVTSPVQLLEVAETEAKLTLIKQEKPEEDLRNGAVEWRAGSREKRPVEETQNKAANHTEELTEQHRTRRAVWEVSGLESVLKAEGQSECVETLQHRGAEHRAGGLNSVDSEFMLERPGQLGSYCTQETVEFGGDSASDVNSELRLVHVTKETGGKSWSSLTPQDESPDGVIMDSVPVKMEDGVQIQPFWNMESRSGAFGTQRRGSVSTPYADGTARESVALPHAEPPDASGGVSFERSLFPSPSTVTCAVGTRKERYVCKYCGKGCTRASDLKVHHRVHTGEKPFSCTQCGRRFSQSCSLKKHLIVHTGEKPFGCLQCGRQFSDSSNLRKHTRVHTGERPFSCSQCGRRFKQLCYLKAHLRIHTGEKSLGCAYCGKEFASKYSLKLHQLKNHMSPYSEQ